MLTKRCEEICLLSSQSAYNAHQLEFPAYQQLPQDACEERGADLLPSCPGSARSQRPPGTVALRQWWLGVWKTWGSCSPRGGSCLRPQRRWVSPGCSRRSADLHSEISINPKATSKRPSATYSCCRSQLTTGGHPAAVTRPSPETCGVCPIPELLVAMLEGYC